MLSLEEALAAVLSGIRPGSSDIEIGLEDAKDRYLAASVFARNDHPPFANSSMDGYALKSADSATEAVLPIRGEARCGNVTAELTPGSAMRIFTGAPLPVGADAVVQQEAVRVDDGAIHLQSSIPRGQNVRRAGEDFRTGTMLYEAGRRLHGWDLPVLAAAGISRLQVRTAPKALVFATGDELALPGTPLAPGKVYESNRLATVAALNDLGAQTVDGGVVGDDLNALRRVVAESGAYDFIITSGGVSVGDYDLVRQAFAEAGDVQFWRARIKPGKPLAFGQLGARAHFFALPGNPVSSLITFKLFVEPALCIWHGAAPPRAELTAIAQHSFKRNPGRAEFLRARLQQVTGQLMASAFLGQESHMVGPLRETNGLIRLDEQSDGFADGDRLTVIPLTLDFS